MSTKIQIRRDTASAWTTANPALANGEIGYETDTRNIKIGDGTTVWTSLKYQAPYYTGANSGAPNTLLAIDVTNSRVGIGTTSPQGPLQVAGSILYGTSGASHLIGSDGSNNAVSNAFAGHVFQVAASEKVRILSSGNVGIGTNNPASPLHIEGSSPAVRLKDTTAGNLAYSIIDGNSDDGSINIAADPTAQGAAASTVSLSVDGTTRLQATTTGVAIAGTASASGLITANGGVTVPNAKTLTVAEGGSITFPTSTPVLNGQSLVNNTVALNKLGQISTPSFIGTPSGTATPTSPSALTQSDARSMLGLVPAAYNTVGATNNSWTNLALTDLTCANINLDVTTLTIGVITRIPIALGKSSGNNPAYCKATTDVGETLLILGGYDMGGVLAFNGGTAATATALAWYWRNVVWNTTTVSTAMDTSFFSFIPMFLIPASQTWTVLRWGQLSGTTQQVAAEVIAIRLS